MTPDRRVDADRVVEFIDALRDADFGIDTAQAIAVHDVLLHLVARGEAGDGTHVAACIGPIVSRTPEEQVEFGALFRIWQPHILPGSSSTAGRPPAVPQRPHTAGELARLARTRRTARVLLGTAAVLVLIVVVQALRPPPTAVLRIGTLPDSAQVWLAEGRAPAGARMTATRPDSLGLTPLEVTLEAGDYALRIGRAGHADTVVRVTVADTAMRLDVALARRLARLRLTTEPAGAVVVVDGDSLGTTPFDGAVPVGRREVWLVRPGHVPHGDSIEVSGPTAPAPIELEPLQATPVRIAVSPATAEVIITDARLDAFGFAAGTATADLLAKWLGFLGVIPTPVVGTAQFALPPGRYVVKVGEATHHEQRLDLSVTSEALDTSVVLAPLRRVRVTSVDPFSTLFVNGEVVRPGSTLEVFEGVATVTWSRPGYEPMTEPIELTRDTMLLPPERMRPLREPLLRVAFNATGDSVIAGRAPGDGPLFRWSLDRSGPPDTVSQTTGGGATSPVEGQPFATTNATGDRRVEAGAAGGVALYRPTLPREPVQPAWELIDSLAPATRRFTAVSFTPDGAAVAMGAEDGEMLLHAIRPIREDGFDAGGRALALSPDGSLLAAAGRNGDIVLFDLARDTRIDLPPDTSVADVTALGITHAFFAAGRADGVLELRTRDVSADSTPAGTLVGQWRVGSPVRRIVHDTGFLLVVTDAGVRYRMHPDDFYLESMADPVPAATEVDLLDNYQASGTGDGLIRLRHVEYGGDTLATVSGPVQRLAGSRRVLAASWAAPAGERSFQVWHVATREPLLPDTAGARLAVADLAISDDGSRLATVDTAGQVVVWNPGAPRSLAARGPGPIRDIAFDASGSRVAVASPDSLLILNALTGERYEALAHGDLAAFEGVAFSPDGSRIATAAADGTVRLWKAGSRSARLAQAVPRLRSGLTAAAMALALLGLVALLLYRRRQGDFFFVRRATDREPPHLERVRIASADARLIDEMQSFRLARALRRRTGDPSHDLDVARTVRRTAARGGRFEPVFRPRRVVPEYLVLIDRTTFQDHQARFADALFDRLATQEVHIARYYFDGDPRTCFPPGPLGGGLTLQALAQRHPDHRLVLCADARVLYDPVTGEREVWADQLMRWKHRTLLTPESTARWGRYEYGLAESMTIGRLTTDGLNTLAGTAPAASGQDDRARFPDTLRRRPERWIGRDAPPDPAVEEMLAGVRAYLDPAGWIWLAACAAYPAINWRLTLALGDALRDGDGTPLLQPDRLAALARLPWLRHGTCPDWLRLRLLDELTPDREREVRRVLEALLVTAASGAGEVDDLEFVRERPRVLDALARRLLRQESRHAPPNHPITDRVFLAFMAGKRPGPLAVRVPRAFRDTLGNRKGRVPPGARARSRRLARALGVAPLIVGGLALAGLTGWRSIEPAPVPLEQLATLSMELPAAPIAPATEPVEPVDYDVLLTSIPAIRRVVPVAVLVMGNVVLFLALVTSLRESRGASGSVRRRRGWGALVAKIIVYLGLFVLAPLATMLAAVVALAYGVRDLITGPHARAVALRRARAGVAIAVVGMIVVTAVSAIRGRQLVERVRAATAAETPGMALAAIYTAADASAALARLAPFREAIVELAARMEGGVFALPLRIWGAEDVVAAARQRYFDQLAPVWATVRDSLADYLASMPDQPDYDAYDALRAYLVVTGRAPADAETAPVGLTLPGFVPADLRDDPNLAAHLAFMADELPRDNPYPADPAGDDALVVSARALLVSLSPLDRALAVLVSDMSDRFPAVSLGDGEILAGAVTVPGAFTAPAWSWSWTTAGLSDTTMARESWVLGEAFPDVDANVLADSVRRRYAAEYARVWAEALAALSVRPFDGRDDAARARRMAGLDSPLVHALALASTHTAIDDLGLDVTFATLHEIVPPGGTTLGAGEPVRWGETLVALADAVEDAAADADAERLPALAVAAVDVRAAAAALVPFYATQAEENAVERELLRLLQAPADAVGPVAVIEAPTILAAGKPVSPSQPVSGQVEVVYRIRPLAGSRVPGIEVMIDGRTVCSQPPVGSTGQVPSAGFSTFRCTFDSAAVDRAGGRLYPDGPHELTARALAGPFAAPPVPVALTFANARPAYQ